LTEFAVLFLWRQPPWRWPCKGRSMYKRHLKWHILLTCITGCTVCWIKYMFSVYWTVYGWH